MFLCMCVWICQVFMKKKEETSKEHKSDKCCASPSPPLFISMCRLSFLSSFNIPSSLYIVDTFYFPTLVKSIVHSFCCVFTQFTCRHKPCKMFSVGSNYHALTSDRKSNPRCFRLLKMSRQTHLSLHTNTFSFLFSLSAYTHTLAKSTVRAGGSIR